MKGCELIKKQNRSKLFLLLVLAIILLLILIAAFKSCSVHTEATTETTTSNSELDFQPAYHKDKTISIPSVSGIVFKAHSINQKFEFENPAANNCYIVLEIVLSDNTVIFESDKIYPDESITDIQLNQELKEGLYRNCKIKYNCFSVDDNKRLNSAESLIEINSK